MAEEIPNSISSDSLSRHAQDSDKSGKSSRQSSQVDLSEKRFFALYSYVAHRFHQKSGSSSEESGVSRGQSSTELSVSDFLQAEATSDGDFSLTIVSTNLSAEKETGLRKCLAHKISKGAVYSGTGSIVPLNLSSSEDSSAFSCQMYFNLLRNTDQNGQESEYKGANSREFLVCFLAPPEDGLDLFQKDLDAFSKGLLTHIDAECLESVKSAANTSTPQLTEINTGIRDYLEKWYEVAIGYVLDCVSTLQHAVKYLIYAAMTGSQLKVEGADEATTTLCHRFVECCSLVELLHSGQPDKRDSSPVLVDLSDCTDDSQPPANQQKTVLLIKGDNSYSCDISDLPKFSEDWANALLGGDNPSAASLRRIIESYKLKCIQDLNFLTRLLRLAENDYYALHRAYVFLKHSGNGRILLSFTQLEQQVTESAEGASVLNALESFLQDTGVLTA